MHTYINSICCTFNQSSVNYIFERDGFQPSFHSIAGNHNLRLAVNDSLCYCVSREASKHNLNIIEHHNRQAYTGSFRQISSSTKWYNNYRVNSTNASTSKHCNGQLHQHWQVDHHGITLSNTNAFQVIRQLSHSTPEHIKPLWPL